MPALPGNYELCVKKTLSGFFSTRGVGAHKKEVTAFPSAVSSDLRMSDKLQFVENIRHIDKLKFVGQFKESMLDAANRNIIS